MITDRERSAHFIAILQCEVAPRGKTLYDTAFIVSWYNLR
jgi:hypothetical protein